MTNRAAAAMALVLGLQSLIFLPTAFGFTGNVRFLVNGSAVNEDVIIPTVGGTVLSNDFVTIQNLPSSVVVDEDGCFCYDPSNDAFAYVNAFYYASSEILYFNRLLGRLGYAPLRHINIELQRIDGLAGSGTAGNGHVNLTFAESLFDPTLLAHEIGHEIHFHLLGMSPNEWYQRYISSNPEIMAQQIGIIEGAANILAALFIRDSRIGALSYFDVAADVNSFVSMERLPSVAEVDAIKLKSQDFANAYPKTVKDIQDELSDPKTQKYLKLPEAYWASAIIEQPLWLASGRFGRRQTIEGYLNALKGFPEVTTFDKFAEHVVQTAPSQLMQHFLIQEYRRRGLLL